MSDVCRVCGKTGAKMVMMAPEKPITHLSFSGNWKEFGPVCEVHADNPPLGEGLAEALEHEIQKWHNDQNSRIYTNAGVWKKIPVKATAPTHEYAPGPNVDDPIFHKPDEEVPIGSTMPYVDSKIQEARERMAYARSMKGKGGTS